MIFFDIHPLHQLYGGENAFLLRDYVSAIKSSGLRIQKILSPFATVINYAPYSKNDLRSMMQEKISSAPFGDKLGEFLQIESVFALFLKFIAIIDQRPGRLFSFIAHKSYPSPRN